MKHTPEPLKQEKTVFEEIGEFMEKETVIERMLDDPETLSIVIDKLEERGWLIH